ncbi:MAG: cadherin domain-containing protein, partial [Alphaproteobacteria bacterium]|nr:cadherin domain-containing protein [Alphaproteobacteria bacterium]
SYTLNMLVTDALGLTGSVAVTINITDINEMPVIDTNAGVTLDEGDNIVITAAMLSASDVDAPPDSALIYTVTNAVDHGTLRNTNSGQTIGQGQTFTQGAINSGYIVYTHNSSETVADSFSFTVTDGTLTTAAQIFNITVTPVNDAPTFDPVTTILQANPGVLYNADTGNFYRYITTTANLSTAQANANAALLNGQGGYVATVTSAAENTYLRSIISSTVWLGGTDSAVEGEWRWQGGAEAGQLFWQGAAGGAVQNGLYAGWNGGEPNNSGGNEDGIELRTNGSWNDTNVNGARAYVIEWDGADVLAPLYNGPYTMAENELAGYIVGTADGYDPDIGDSVTYSITGGTGAAGFSINTSNGQITLTNAAMANFELSATYTIDLRIEDTAGLFDVMTVTINLTDMNDIPVLLDMTDNFVMENSAFDTVVATLSTMDEDPADVHSYSLISNPGNKFAIVGNELRTAGLIDYEQAQSILLTLRVDDGNGGQFDRTVTINIGDQQDTFTPPPNTGISTGNNADIIVPTDDLMPGKSLLQATLSGGDTGQMNAFYGLGEFTQILREYVGDALKNFLTHATASATAQDNSVTPPAELQIVDGPEKLAEPAQDTSAAQFTNLREALQFLSQIDQATKAGPGEQGDALSQQFVDVMTYHEQKQMRLRAALQDS